MTDSAGSLRGRTWIVLAIIGAVVQLGLLWGTSIPLGVPGEWAWPRFEWSAPILWTAMPAVIWGLLFFTVVLRTSNRLLTASPRSVPIWLIGMWIGGTIWLFCLMSSIPGIGGLSRGPFVLYYTRTSGYFLQAREINDLGEFLQTYDERIADSTVAENYLHLGTHPPGLTISLYLLQQLCRNVPLIEDVALATQPTAIRDSLAIIQLNAAQSGKSFDEADAAALWLATAFVTICAAGTVCPLFLLIRRNCDADTAWIGAACWLLVPAVTIFLPKSDALFPFLAMWIQWLWLKTLDRRSIRYGFATGFVLLFSVLLSLAFLPLGLILILQFFLHRNESTLDGDAEWTAQSWRAWRAGLATAAMFLGLLGMLSWWSGLNLPAVFVQNLRNHAAFYDHNHRSSIPWLVVNPFELLFSLGLPLAIAAVMALPILLRDWTRHRDLLPAVLVWTILWLSGKNMGEAARLWIFLMPYFVWLASLTIARLRASTERDENRTCAIWLMLQALVCLGTVLAIDGFGFSEVAQLAG